MLNFLEKSRFTTLSNFNTNSNLGLKLYTSHVINNKPTLFTLKLTNLKNYLISQTFYLKINLAQIMSLSKVSRKTQQYHATKLMLSLVRHSKAILKVNNIVKA